MQLLLIKSWLFNNEPLSLFFSNGLILLEVLPIIYWCYPMTLLAESNHDVPICVQPHQVALETERVQSVSLDFSWASSGKDKQCRVTRGLQSVLVCPPYKRDTFPVIILWRFSSSNPVGTECHIVPRLLSLKQTCDSWAWKLVMRWAPSQVVEAEIQSETCRMIERLLWLGWVFPQWALLWTVEDRAKERWWQDASWEGLKQMAGQMQACCDLEDIWR